MNIFTFTGNLGKDCEVKYLQSGTATCTFSVAVKSGFGDNVKTSWPRCTIFGKRAESKLPEYLKKGAQVCISGELSLDEWQGQDGTAQKMFSVNVIKIDLIGGNPQSAAAPTPSAAQPSAQGNFQQPDNFDPDQDIPF